MKHSIEAVVIEFGIKGASPTTCSMVAKMQTVLERQPIDPCDAENLTHYRTMECSPICSSVPGYRILQRLGEGGMGSVDMAECLSTRKTVVIKRIHSEIAGNKNSLKRFLKECELHKRFKHPRIVSVLDSGVLPDGSPYLVMDYVNAENLDTMLQKGPLSLYETRMIAAQIGEALSYAHERGVVHRDIKPGNILVRLNESPSKSEVASFLVDFGIAKEVAEEDRNATKLTKTGAVIGSPMYMSPEQCLGHKLDCRSDIYSLACVLFECLAGRPPYEGENAVATILKHLNDEIPSLPEFDKERISLNHFNACLKVAMSKSPTDRYASANEFLQVLLAQQDETQDVTKSGTPVWSKSVVGKDRNQSQGTPGLLSSRPDAKPPDLMMIAVTATRENLPPIFSKKFAAFFSLSVFILASSVTWLAIMAGLLILIASGNSNSQSPSGSNVTARAMPAESTGMKSPPQAQKGPVDIQKAPDANPIVLARDLHSTSENQQQTGVIAEPPASLEASAEPAISEKQSPEEAKIAMNASSSDINSSSIEATAGETAAQSSNQQSTEQSTITTNSQAEVSNLAAEEAAESQTSPDSSAEVAEIPPESGN